MNRIMFNFSRSTTALGGMYFVSHFSDQDWRVIVSAAVLGLGSFMMGLDGPERK